MEYSNDFMLPEGEDEVSENIQAKFADGNVFDLPLSVFEWRLMTELFSAAQKEGRQVASVWTGSNQDGSLNLRVRITPQSGRLPLISLENAETRKTLTTVTAWKENPDGEKSKDVLVQIGKDVIDGKISLDTIKCVKAERLKAVKKRKKDRHAASGCSRGCDDPRRLVQRGGHARS